MCVCMHMNVHNSNLVFQVGHFEVIDKINCYKSLINSIECRVRTLALKFESSQQDSNPCSRIRTSAAGFEPTNPEFES